MRKALIMLIHVLLVLAAGTVCAETREEPVRIVQLACGEDNQLFGYIAQTEIVLNEGDTVLVTADEVFDMYPEHEGLYGIVYTDGTVTLMPGGDGSAPVSGSGVMEFSFPGAASCTVTGAGQVYAYFLPVPYYRLSSDVSLVDQPFDTSCLTPTALGHQNMFIITDPHLWIFQEHIVPEGTVTKWCFSFGEFPEEYSQFMPLFDGDNCLFPFLSDLPLVVQCGALSVETYEKDSYCARPMEMVKCGDGYEIWCYRDYQAQEDTYDTIGRIFDACTELANEQFLGSGLGMDKSLIVLLREELNRAHMDGLAVTEALMDRIGFQNYMFYNTFSWENHSEYLDFLCAHEIGHIVQSATLSSENVEAFSWFMEGFADFFAEKVCERLGIGYHKDHYVVPEDARLIDLFQTDMIFGVTNWTSYSAASNEGRLLVPGDPYSFGYLFMKYLEDTYGAGFYRSISDVFYEKYYEGQEENFFYSRDALSYNVDGFFRLIRDALSPDVYLNYPGYARTHFSDCIAWN